ncbi:hypothetical protein BD560DRAFT_386907 [Blakeslea trispora]|nr:hypothetical protein BD560DRAFT_386907 [Blakeslea trispora]
MKFNPRKTFLYLLATNLLFSASNADELETTYYQNLGFKNVIFYACIGGASHYNWVLSILDELGSRGHNVSFLTSESVVKFAKPFQHVDAVALVPDIKYDAKVVGNSAAVRKDNRSKFFATVLKFVYSNYEEAYLALQKHFIENKVDLALCDHFADACIDAAVSVGIPFSITAVMPMTKDGMAPYINDIMATTNRGTSEHQTLMERFNLKYIQPLMFFRHAAPFLNDLIKRKRALGIDARMEDPSYTWRDALKLCNNAFGFIPARPLGPLTELVGPIIPKQHKPLSEPIKQYLDQHKRVAYVAFGQTATPSTEDATMILSALLESLDRNYIDGILWATVNDAEIFPPSINTSSGTVYNTELMLNAQDPHVRMVSWAPQMAVLLHPSVGLFVSHGGMGSFHESVYAGKRMLMFPFFGDQPRNAELIEENKLGVVFRERLSSVEMAEAIHRLLEDKDGQVEDSMKRAQAHTQIASKNSVARAADLVEEVLYTLKDGLIEHRITADRRMSFIKANNIDLYALLALVLACVLSIFGFATFKLFIFGKSYFQKTKVKTQ